MFIFISIALKHIKWEGDINADFLFFSFPKILSLQTSKQKT